MMLYCAFVMAGLPHHYSQPSAAPVIGNYSSYIGAAQYTSGMCGSHLAAYLGIYHKCFLCPCSIIFHPCTPLTSIEVTFV